MYQGCSQGVFFFTEALAEFQHVTCMIVRIWEVEGVAVMLGFTEAVASMPCAYMCVQSFTPPDAL